MTTVTKEQFTNAWMNSSKEAIINQFYYDHKDLCDLYEKVADLENKRNKLLDMVLDLNDKNKYQANKLKQFSSVNVENMQLENTVRALLGFVEDNIKKGTVPKSVKKRYNELLSEYDLEEYL